MFYNYRGCTWIKLGWAIFFSVLCFIGGAAIAVMALLNYLGVI